jgi:hypothetical protein
MKLVLLIVVLVAGGVYLSPTIKGYFGKRRALEALPREAERLGLRPQADRPVLKGQLPVFKGSFRGRDVGLFPDAYGTIEVRLVNAPAISLSTQKDRVVDPSGLETFETGDRKFDKTFPHRLASPEVAGRLKTDSSLRELLLEFRSKVRELSLTSTLVSCQADSGGTWMHYIQPDRLEPILSGAVDVAERVDAALR